MLPSRGPCCGRALRRTLGRKELLPCRENRGPAFPRSATSIPRSPTKSQTEYLGSSPTGCAERIWRKEIRGGRSSAMCWVGTETTANRAFSVPRTHRKQPRGCEAPRLDRRCIYPIPSIWRRSGGHDLVTDSFAPAWVIERALNTLGSMPPAQRIRPLIAPRIPGRGDSSQVPHRTGQPVCMRLQARLRPLPSGEGQGDASHVGPGSQGKGPARLRAKLERRTSSLEDANLPGVGCC